MYWVSFIWNESRFQVYHCTFAACGCARKVLTSIQPFDAFHVKRCHSDIFPLFNLWPTQFTRLINECNRAHFMNGMRVLVCSSVGPSVSYGMTFVYANNPFKSGRKAAIKKWFYLHCKWQTSKLLERWTQANYPNEQISRVDINPLHKRLFLLF